MSCLAQYFNIIHGYIKNYTYFQFFFFFLILIICVWHACLSTLCVPSALEGQKRTSLLPELELGVVIGCCLVLRIKPGSLEAQPVLLSADPDLWPLATSSPQLYLFSFQKTFLFLCSHSLVTTLSYRTSF